MEPAKKVGRGKKATTEEAKPEEVKKAAPAKGRKGKATTTTAAATTSKEAENEKPEEKMNPPPPPPAPAPKPSAAAAKPTKKTTKAEKKEVHEEPQVEEAKNKSISDTLQDNKSKSYDESTMQHKENHELFVSDNMADKTEENKPAQQKQGPSTRPKRVAKILDEIKNDQVINVKCDNKTKHTTSTSTPTIRRRPLKAPQDVSMICKPDEKVK